MNQHECIQAIAKKHYEIRLKNDLSGTSESDWEYAKQVYRFFADCTIPRTSEWQGKMDDYQDYIEIYEQSLWVI